MDLGIIGYQRSGKTTIFNAVTRGHAQTGAYGAGVQPNIGVVKVPDQRLEDLSKLFNPKKFTLADIRYIDFPGEAFSEGHGPPPQFLAQLARCDALIHVVRAFADETVPHPQGSVDPARDAAAMELELAFADAAFIEKRLERIEASMRAVKAGERDAAERETALLLRLKQGLEAETPLREQEMSAEEEKLLVNYQFLSDKPLLVVLNINDADAARASEIEAEFAAKAHGQHLAVAAISGKIEQELAQMSEEDAVEFRNDLGITEPGLDRMIRMSYELTGLISFFTVGPDECRAWNVRRGAVAPTAAGKIHTDLERGFIRAEVVRWDELLAAGSIAEARKHGHLRQEGKAYVVQDGDCLNILFNV
ncbi:MAG: redox-regulated ATPase YchF [Dehalococcoidia bacterium]|nr:MAG: redox-regulated ATPase YchF [Dehalococcoidia bacterium]